jgi:hypothetical protein
VDIQCQLFFAFKKFWPNKCTSTSISRPEKVAAVMRIGGAPKGNADMELKTKKKKKGNQKPKLNITLPEVTKQKLAALAQLEKRSMSNLIEIMADERWEALAEREGIDYAKTVAEIAGLKGLRVDKETDRKKFRREILDRVLKFKK